MWRKFAYASLGLLLLGVNGCSKEPVVAPVPTTPAPVELQFDARFSAQEGTYTLRSLEYADESGIVHQVQMSDPHVPWRLTQTLMPGARLYMRAELEYTSVFVGLLQVTGASDGYHGSSCERVDGPGSVVLVIDERVR